MENKTEAKVLDGWATSAEYKALEVSISLVHAAITEAYIEYIATWHGSTASRLVAQVLDSTLKKADAVQAKELAEGMINSTDLQVVADEVFGANGSGSEVWRTSAANVLLKENNFKTPSSAQLALHSSLEEAEQSSVEIAFGSAIVLGPFELFFQSVAKCVLGFALSDEKKKKPGGSVGGNDIYRQYELEIFGNLDVRHAPGIVHRDQQPGNYPYDEGCVQAYAQRVRFQG